MFYFMSEWCRSTKLNQKPHVNNGSNVIMAIIINIFITAEGIKHKISKIKAVGGVILRYDQSEPPSRFTPEKLPLREAGRRAA